MAPKTNKRKRSFPPTDHAPSSPLKTSSGENFQRPIRWDLIILFLTISIGGTYLAMWLRPKQDAPRYTYTVLKTYPHDAGAFTQGLLMDGGFLWESTGREGQSSIRKIDLDTGKILQQHDLKEEDFGEGLTVFQDQLFQLTWKNEKIYVYDRELKPIKEIPFEHEGWGLTTNGQDLIFSNGTSEIRFLDPKTLETRRSIRVRRGGMRVGRLNELEYINGKIFASVYQTDFLYEIDPNTGDVESVIDLSSLWPTAERPDDGLLNGIAVNPKSRKLLVTGKLCPHIFEIELKLKK